MYGRLSNALFHNVLWRNVCPLSRQVEEEESQGPAHRRRSLQDSLSLPVPISQPANGQKEESGTARPVGTSRSNMELSVPQFSPGTSSESSPISPTKDSSPSGFLRNVKKRESKGKGKEAKGNIMHIWFWTSVIWCTVWSHSKYIF